MILFVLAALCLISVPLMGGRLGLLAEIELRLPGLAIAALALQLTVVDLVPQGLPALHAALHVFTYVMGGVFLVANRHLAGAGLIALGAGLNAIVICVNGGVMPEAASARRIAGLVTGGGFQNSARLAHAHLLILGDVIPIPGPRPLGNTLSLGDVIIYAGMLVLVHRVCRPAARLVLVPPPLDVTG